MEKLAEKIEKLADEFSREKHIYNEKNKNLISQAMLKAAILALEYDKEIERQYFEDHFGKVK